MKDSVKILSQTKNSWEPWLIALRPQSLTASFAPVLIGTFLALSQGFVIDWILALMTLFSAFFIQTGTNLVNDAYDYKRGADTNERLGPIRLVQRGLLSSKQVHFLGITSFLLALFFGIPLVLKGGLVILFILILSCLCGYFYTGGSVSLAYTGLADLFVILFFGIVLTVSTYFLQTSVLNLSACMAGIQIGLLATVIIAINNLRDHVQDTAVQKRTLAVRFGKTFGRCEITVLSLLPFFLGFYWVGEGQIYAAVLPWLALPLAYKLIKGIWTHEPSKVYNRFFALGAMLHLFFGLLLSLGFYISP